jgi:hypothetical protein
MTMREVFGGMGHVATGAVGVKHCLFTTAYWSARLGRSLSLILILGSAPTLSSARRRRGVPLPIPRHTALHKGSTTSRHNNPII